MEGLLADFELCGSWSPEGEEGLFFHALAVDPRNGLCLLTVGSGDAIPFHVAPSTAGLSL
jgi:hypothetical protein